MSVHLGDRSIVTVYETHYQFQIVTLDLKNNGDVHATYTDLKSAEVAAKAFAVKNKMQFVPQEGQFITITSVWPSFDTTIVTLKKDLRCFFEVAQIRSRNYKRTFSYARITAVAGSIPFVPTFVLSNRFTKVEELEEHSRKIKEDLEGFQEKLEKLRTEIIPAHQEQLNRLVQLENQLEEQHKLLARCIELGIDTSSISNTANQSLPTILKEKRDVQVQMSEAKKLVAVLEKKVAYYSAQQMEIQHLIDKMNQNSDAN